MPVFLVGMKPWKTEKKWDLLFFTDLSAMEELTGSTICFNYSEIHNGGLPKEVVWADVLAYFCFLQHSLPGVFAGNSVHKIVFGREFLNPGKIPREDIPAAPGKAKALFQ